jgi:signal peptidase II
VVSQYCTFKTILYRLLSIEGAALLWVSLGYVVKQWAIAHPYHSPWFAITITHNHGIAFGWDIGLPWVGHAVLGLLAWYVARVKFHPHHPVLSVCFLGGAWGNVLERLHNGYVTDYLQFSFQRYAFPVFNVADVLLTLSVSCWIIMPVWKRWTFRNRLWCKRQQDQAKQPF